ncbi:hypothetical protein Hanom_Chr08g00725751 [Helianthus anomalus]
MLCSFVHLHILFILSCKVAACTMRCLPRLSFSSCHLFAAFHFSRFLICCSLNAGSHAFVNRNLSRSESSVTCNLIGFPSFTIYSGICLSFYCINFTFGWLIRFCNLVIGFVAFVLLSVVYIGFLMMVGGFDMFVELLSFLFMTF